MYKELQPLLDVIEKNEKKYDLDKIKQLLLEAGLEFVAMYDAYTNEPVSEESEKILFVARECTK